MSIDFPKIFPSPTISGYQLNPDESIISSKMDSGRVQKRRQFTNFRHIVSVRWIFPTTLLGLFEAWFVYKIHNGASWFNMPISNGYGYGSNRCRFDGPYSVTLISAGLWETTANLEVSNISMYTEDAYDVAISLGAGSDPNSGINEYLTQATIVQKKLHKYINIDLGQRYQW